MNLSTQQLARYTRSSVSDATKYAAPLTDAMTQFGITSSRNVAAFLATVSVESCQLTCTEENLYYKSADRLAQIFPRAFKNAKEAAPFTRNPLALSKKLYSGYHGRGLIQLTWQANYAEAGAALGYDYVKTPGLLTTPKHAALSAAWFWATRGCKDAADKGDMREVTRRINGLALLNLGERTAIYLANVAALASIA